MSFAGELSEVSCLAMQVDYVPRTLTGAVSPMSSEESLSTESRPTLDSSEETITPNTQEGSGGLDVPQGDSGRNTPDGTTDVSGPGESVDPDRSGFETSRPEASEMPDTTVTSLTSLNSDPEDIVEYSMDLNLLLIAVTTYTSQDSQDVVCENTDQESIVQDASHEKVAVDQVQHHSVTEDSHDFVAAFVSHDFGPAYTRDSMAADTDVESSLRATQRDAVTVSIDECLTTHALLQCVDEMGPQQDANHRTTHHETIAEDASTDSSDDSAQDASASPHDYNTAGRTLDYVSVDTTQAMFPAYVEQSSSEMQPTNAGVGALGIAQVSSFMDPAPANTAAEVLASDSIQGPHFTDMATRLVARRMMDKVTINTQVAELSSSRSELSPFAEPFTPRLSPFPTLTSDTPGTHTLELSVGKPQFSVEYSGHVQDPKSSTGDRQDNAVLPMLEGPCQQILPPAYFQEARSLVGSRLQQVVHNTTHDSPFGVSASCFDLFFSQPVQSGPLPIGHERAKSASSVPNTWSVSNAGSDTTDSAERLMDFCTKLGSLMTDAPILSKILTGSMDTDPLTTDPAMCSNNGTEPRSILERGACPAEVSNRLTRSTSCMGNWTVNDRVNEEGLHRVMSSPELQSGEQAVPSGQRGLHSHGTGHTGADIADASDFDNLSAADGDKTLLAEATPEWQENCLDLPPHLWVWNDSAAPWEGASNTEEKGAMSRKRLRPKSFEGKSLTGYSKRLSADSGLGSLSDHSSNLVIPKADSDSDDLLSSPARLRLCSQHNEEVTMYCTENCVLMCQLCRTDHARCQRVMNVSSACRDVKNRLLKVQSALDGHIHTLEKQAEELTPKLDELAEQKQEEMEKANDQFQETIKNIRETHNQQLKELDEEFDTMERGAHEKKLTVEQTLSLLKVANSFVEVLRCQDSGWNLLSTYDQRLRLLLNKVLQTAEFNQVYIQSIDVEKQKLDDCREVAYNSVKQLMECEWTDDMEEPSKQESGSTIEVGKVDDTEDWSAMYLEQLASGFEREADWRIDAGIIIPRKSEYTPPDNIDILKRELKEFEKCCSSKLNLKNVDDPPTPRPSLYGLMDDGSLPTPTDMYDEVFLYESKSHDESPPSDIFTRHFDYESSSEYKVQQRLSVYFPSDRERVFVTDIHITETGFLLFLDAANNCMKRFYLPQVDRSPSCLPVQQPLCLCSAGWERVMVSSAGRTLAIYSVGGRTMQLVLSRTTQHQYRGLVRASDSLVAAACPETHSVHLLDLAGRALRSIMPVDFVRGPEVVGVTRHGELLVVHQPTVPPTSLVCFDMMGTVLWSRALHTPARHVSCCKVAGGEDGQVYLALQGDSVLYRVDPATGRETVLLNSRDGVKLPSSLALLPDGHILVTRNELPSVASSHSSPHTMLPTTAEIDVFVRHGSDTSSDDSC